MDVRPEDEQDLKALWRRFRRDIPFFAEKMLGEENALRPKQIEFAEKFQKNRLITFKGGVGFGKTRSMAVIIIWALFVHDDIKVTVFGPSQDQIKNGLWSEIKSLCGKLPEAFKDYLEVQETVIKRKSRAADCFAVHQTANKESVENARGIHKKNNFIFVDEATGVPNEVFQVLINILVDKNSKLCLISNPSVTSGFFFDTWRNDTISAPWAKIHGRAFDNPDLTQEKLADMTALYGGEGSRQYRIMIEGDFPDNDENGLISRALVMLAVNREKVVPAPNSVMTWGLDVAGAGTDRTVLIKRHDIIVPEMPLCWNGLDSVQVAHKVREEYQKTPVELKPAVIAIDTNGVGYGVWSVLRDWGLPVEDVNTSRSPTRADGAYGKRFFQLRDQLWWQLKEWLETERVSLPREQNLIDEMCAPSYEDFDKIKVESKKTLKKRIKVSPDFADALCLTFAVDTTKYVGKYAWNKPLYADEDLRWLQ